MQILISMLDFRLIYHARPIVKAKRDRHQTLLVYYGYITNITYKAVGYKMQQQHHVFKKLGGEEVVCT